MGRRGIKWRLGGDWLAAGDPTVNSAQPHAKVKSGQVKSSPVFRQISTADRAHARTGPDTQRAQAHNHTQNSNPRTHPTEKPLTFTGVHSFTRTAHAPSVGRDDEAKGHLLPRKAQVFPNLEISHLGNPSSCALRSPFEGPNCTDVQARREHAASFGVGSSRKSEVGSRKSEVGSRKSEVGSRRKSEVSSNGVQQLARAERRLAVDEASVS